MCGTCGCGEDNSVKYIKPGEAHTHEHNHVHSHTHSHGDIEHTHDHVHAHTHEHEHNDNSNHDNVNANHHSHDHEHPHSHSHSHDHSHGKEILVEQNVLLKNNLIAERNRGYFEAKNIFTVNLVSSPGSGKTSLLEKTIKDLKKDLNIYVIEGDQQTINDAERIQKTGAPVIQINTGNGCHLDAEMINNASKQLDIKDNSVLFIENVGNLVCPSMFDLGESKRVVIISTTEGEDKPVKYPTMFETAHLCIINKTDLLPYLDFDLKKCIEYAKRVNHHLEFIELSVKTGEGLEKWYQWLKNNL
ncbi:MAG: hydrogenase nickel incorporation protein HypB [Marinilabiliales bacterium]